jgi:hypothetical protein
MKKSFISRLVKPQRFQRVREKILSFFFLNQWILLIAKGAQNESASWNNFTPLRPPSDRLWADPFVWEHGDNYYIFYEERLYSSNRGHIACLTLDNQMNPIANCVVLERPYHLSYPFIFEHQEQIYMIPETEKNGTVELYRCTCFPDHWVFAKTLLADIKAVDATLLEADGKWWLFANIRERGSSWHALHLFHTDHLLSDQWIPHPRNPIVKDIGSARPAGRIFLHNGELIRPSQDCSVRYGYATKFNHITALTDSNYAEICKWSFKPPRRRNILGTHTWNAAGDLTTIDALIRKPRYWADQST